MSSTIGPTEPHAAEFEALFQAAVQIAYQERAIEEEMAAALDRNDVPAVMAAARKLCNKPQK